MDVRVTSTGKIFYQMDNAVTALLLEMFPAAIERVNPRPTPKPEDLIPAWGINVNVSGYYNVTFTLGSRTETYFGPPSQLVSYFQKMGIGVPDRIVAQYRPLWKPRDIEHPAVHSAYWAEYEAIQGRNK
jgi:hypothetical protein